MSGEIKTPLPPGTACIKSEYLILDHVRELNTNFIGNKDKRMIDKSINNDSEGPKRKKLKGQNKHRPREKRAPKNEKLCFSVGTKGFCSFGSSCCYSHDVDAYLSTKPKDIGEICYLFETYGNCPYSFSCRFGLKHIVDGKNIVKEEQWNKFKDKKLILNILDKGVQRDLRKRTYNFSQAERALKAIESRNAKSKSCEPAKEADNMAQEDISTRLVVQTLDLDNVDHQSICEAVERKSDESSYPLGGNGPKSEAHLPIEEDIIKLQQREVKKDPDNVDRQSICEAVERKCDESRYPLGGNESKSEAYLPIEEDVIKLQQREVKKIDFRGKLYLAPLTTVGNLPFRRICKEFGADITCSEMAMGVSLLQGNQSEWALLKRHHTEDIFGVQLCGAHPDLMARCSQLLTETTSVDFIDINMGCPLEMVYRKGAGCGLMNRMRKFDDIVHSMSSVMDVPLTVKMRAGVHSSDNTAHSVIQRIRKWEDCISLVTLHGRSREQRYTKLADWSYIDYCCEVADSIPLFGSGDVLSYEDYNLRMKETRVSGIMIARGALIKPWIFKEIKEQRHWDISAGERMDLLKTYVNYGLEHWGSDTEGVEKTRRFLLEWLSFLYRYIPVGLLERLPQHINERPLPYHGRNDLETLMASPSCVDWIKISEMLLGPVPENFVFLPKHKANAYQ